MKRKIKLLSLALSMSFMLTSCQMPNMLKSKSSASDTVSTSESGNTSLDSVGEPTSVDGKETIMVYMVGSDLESQAGLASSDIVEMVNSKFNKDTMNVLICTGGSKQWFINGIPNNKSTVYKIVNDTIEPVYNMKGTNMGDPATLTEFIDYGYDNYKADYYGLVLWNHGGGSIVGYGVDENYGNDCLSTVELNTSFANSKIFKDSNKFEWIGFDACLMGMAEVANMLTPYSNYMIASEELEAGQGWDYGFLSDVSNNKWFKGKDTGKTIIDKYSYYFENTSKYKADYTLSCLDLSESANVIKSLDSFVSAAETELKNGGYSKIAKSRDKAKTFGKVNSEDFYDYVDMYDLAEKMKALYPDESKNLQDSLKQMIKYNKANVSNAYGLSVYFPYANKEYAKQWITDYDQMNFSKTYTTFIDDFAKTLSGEVIDNGWTNEPVAEPVEDTTSEDTYYVQLTDAQAQNYASAQVYLWSKQDDGTYDLINTTTDATLSDDGKLRTTFKGEKFCLSDDSGNSMYSNAAEIERTEEYSKYAVVVLIDDYIQLMKLAYVHVKVYNADNRVEVLGIYEDRGSDSSLFPDKASIEIKDGDYIRPYYIGREIPISADGSVPPMAEWKKNSGLSSVGFEVIGNFNIKLEKVEENKEYLCTMQIRDTQGNKYESNPIVIKK